MQNHPLVLLVSEQPAGTAAIKNAIAGHGSLRLQMLERVSTAVARLAGGGVNLILFDLPPSREGLDELLRLRNAAPDVPVVVLFDAPTETLALQAVRNGALASLNKQSPESDLQSSVAELLVRLPEPRESSPRPVIEEPGAAVLAFTGAKGGVGCTTVALNVASILARRHRVILAEMKPDLSYLRQYLRPQRAVRGLAPLLAGQAAAESSTEVESSLWGSRSMPNLRILFGPQAAQECRPIDPHRAKAVLSTLSKSADYIVLDLPPALSDPSKALLSDCDLMGFVVERDPLCLEYAKSALQGLKDANATPQAFGTVVVNRAALGCPIPLSDFEISLSTSLLGVVPPAADLCISAQKAHTPVVVFDPESLMAKSLLNLAEHLDIRPR